MYKCTKCGFCCGTKREALKHKCDVASLCTNNIGTGHRAGSRSHRQVKGGQNLAFMRGYQAGYEDRVMGKSPECYAREHRKDIRKAESE